MAGMQGQSSLAAALGQRGANAWEQTKGDEAKLSSFGELPPGINGGVAKLVDCKFTQVKEGDNQGKWMFYARAVVLEPVEFTDPQGVTHRCAGKGTSITCPLYDTPDRSSRKTVEEHVQWVQNQFKLLGVQVTDLGVDDLEGTAAALKASAEPGNSPIYLKFRTYSLKATPAFPNPKTLHEWEGACEYTEEAHDPAAGVQDGTGQQAQQPPPAPPQQQVRQAPAMPNGRSMGNGVQQAPQQARTATPAAQPARQAPAPANRLSAPATARQQAPQQQAPATAARPQQPTRPAAQPKPQQQPPQPPPVDASQYGGNLAGGQQFDEYGDLGTLLKRANANDQQAATQLTDMATRAGCDPQEVTNAPSWEVVADMIQQANANAAEHHAAGGMGEGEGDQPAPPAVGDVALYRALSPKTKRPNAKLSDVKVLAVDENAQTCTLQDLATEAEYVNVPWPEVLPAQS